MTGGRRRPARITRDAAIALLGLVLGGAGTALGTAWTVSLNTGSSAEGQSLAAPPAPAAPTATCATGPTVTVTWAAVTGAKSYSVYRGSATTGPWTLLGTVTAPTVGYTTGILSAGTFYFAVTTTSNDSNWPASTQSAASAARTITVVLCA